MLPKKGRFSRTSFPRKKPTSRKSFPWGAVSVYNIESDTTLPRAAVVVSKKNLKEAHDRNKLKRRLYEAVSKAGLKHSVIIFPRSEALTITFDVLVADLKTL